MKMRRIVSSLIIIFAMVLSSLPIAKAANNPTTIMLTVVMKGNQVPLDFATYVQKNGGKIVKQIPEIGVVQVQGTTSLIPIIQGYTQVESVGPSIKMTLPKSKTMVLSSGTSPASLLGMKDKPAVSTQNKPSIGPPPPDHGGGGGVVEPDLYNSLQWDIKEVTHNGASFSLNKGKKSVVVGIIDSGVDSTHPDLAANFLGGRNFVPANEGGDSTETGNSSDLKDRIGHGTHVAGTIAGNGRILGVAPETGFKAYRVFGANGSATTPTVASAIIAAANDGVDVISMSLGGYSIIGQVYYKDPATGRIYNLGKEVADFQIYKRAVKYAVDHGVTVVAAAGNDGLNVTNKAEVTKFLNQQFGKDGYQFIGAGFETPGSLPGVIAVSATGPGDTLASYSNYGSGFVDVTAPGGDFQRPGDEYWFLDMNLSSYKDNGYAFMAGTSMATPKVSAVAALLIAQKGKLGPKKISQLVTGTAEDIGKLGKDEFYGNGMVQAPYTPENLPKELDWQKHIGGLNPDMGRDAHQTRDGGFITVGNTLSYGHVKYDQDIYVVKTGKDGQVEWRRMLGSNYTESAERVMQTKDGGYLVIGESQKDDSIGYYDFYVCKLSANGMTEWEKTFGEKRVGEIGVDELAFNAVETKDGGFLIAGDKKKDGQGEQIYLVKLDSKGKQIWDQIYSGEGDLFANTIKPTSDGGYIIAGKSLSTDPDQYMNFYVLKINSTGKKLWDKSFGNGTRIADNLENIIETSNGDFVAIGNSESQDYDQYGMLVTKSSIYSAMIGKNGNLIKWQPIIDPEDGIYRSIKSMVITSDGNFLAVGYKETGNGDYDNLIVKFSPSGKCIWEKMYGSDDNDFAFSIDNTNNGGYIVIGETQSNTAGPHGDYDFNLMKFNSLLGK